MSRSIPVSIFFICLSLGMSITNGVNTQWYGEFGTYLWNYQQTPYKEMGELGITPTEDGFNQTAQGLLAYNRPQDVSQDYGFFSSIQAAYNIVNFIFFVTVGFFFYLEKIGLLSSFLATPLTYLLIINNIAAIIYIITGKYIY